MHVPAVAIMLSSAASAYLKTTPNVKFSGGDFVKDRFKRMEDT
jgi:hypothetical protein